MDLSTAKCERFTAVASTVVAVLILAAGVSARNGASPNVTPYDLTELESDLRFQINTAFRHDASEQTRRIQLVDESIAAWEASPQSEDDRKLMAAWLRDATIRSVPGRFADFPPIPEFSYVEQQPASEPVSEKVLAEPILAEDHEFPTEQDGTDSVEELSAPLLIGDDRVGPEQYSDISQHISNTPVVPSVSPSDEVWGEVRIEPIPDSDVGPVNDVVENSDGAFRHGSTNDVEFELPVVVNLVELSARIAGYHSGLERLERSLLKSRRPSLSAITDQVNTVDHLSSDFQFVSLYYNSLSSGEQRAIAKPRSLKSTVAELRRQLDRFEESEADDFLEPFDTDILNQIETLRTLLQEISSRIGN